MLAQQVVNGLLPGGIHALPALAFSLTNWDPELQDSGVVHARRHRLLRDAAIQHLWQRRTLFIENEQQIKAAFDERWEQV
jgi:hypothetical protein